MFYKNENEMGLMKKSLIVLCFLDDKSLLPEMFRPFISVIRIAGVDTSCWIMYSIVCLIGFRPSEYVIFFRWTSLSSSLLFCSQFLTTSVISFCLFTLINAPIFSSEKFQKQEVFLQGSIKFQHHQIHFRHLLALLPQFFGTSSIESLV